MDRYSIPNLADRYLREDDKYAQTLLLDHRRMSEPAMYGCTSPTYPSSSISDPRYPQNTYPSPRSFPAYPSPLPRPRHHISPWKDNDHLPLHYDEPLSPLNPTFSGGHPSPSMGMPAVPYGPLHDDYGPSPPGTGTSTSSNPSQITQHPHSQNSPSNSKQYSFVSLPGNAVKKRPRRRYDEIERLYQCSWPDCTKSYGTLNHLNAHVTMQKHGPKRSPNEFKELRKQWRKAKKEEAETRALGAMLQGSQHHPSQRHMSRDSLSEPEYQPYHLRSHSDSAHHPASPDDLHDLEAHQRDVYVRRQQRFSSFASANPRSNGATYTPSSHPHGIDMPMNRLPANSTLLTPLPGYEPPPMGAVTDLDAYASYDVYGTDSRPETGHGSIGSYDDSRRPSYSEDARTRPLHPSLSAQGSTYPH
ncbi:hypothetical protein F5I97DRAFT_1799133 [Phlebopus sp. FC_14]|nr:hypothetical protein F5I97DRAFT_1799133 [Phlebopus sp. FC_14]